MIRIGHDLHRVEEMGNAVALLTPGVFYTAAEAAEIASHRQPLLRHASLFAAKEAFFKACPATDDWRWVDLEISHRPNRRPYLVFHGNLEKCRRQQSWQVDVSISHSGDYVSATVVLVGILEREVS